LLTLGFAAAGTLLARFYHDARVQLVSIAISPTIFFTSTSVLHLALLKRAMRFSQVSANDMVARAMSVVVSIILGWAGCGYWSLIAGAVTLPLSASIGAWCLCRWVPGFPRRVAGTRSVVEFALQTYGRFSVGYFARNTDNLLVGWRFSAQSLGFYKKAYDLFALSASQLVASITVVAVSALSRISRDTPQYQRYLLSAMTFMAFVGMGLAADITLVGKDLIRLLLGPGWEPSGHIFMFFGPGIGIMILYYTHTWVHLSIGRADRWFRWGMVEFAVTFLLLIAGLPWGPVGIAVAWTVSFWILFVPALWYAGRPIGLGVRPVLSAVWKYIVASLAAGLVTALLIRETPLLTDAPGAAGACLRVIAVSLVLTILYLSAVVILHGGFKPLYESAALLREMVPWNRLASALPVLAVSDNNGSFAAREE
jgi:O-antigen/teichoic acid export membrane protein